MDSVLMVRVLTLLVLLMVLPATAAAHEQPAAVVMRVQRAAVTLWRTTGTSPSDDTLEMRAVRENFDISAISRRLLGTAWERAGEDERTSFAQAAADLLALSLARRLGSRGDLPFDVRGETAAPNNDLVLTTTQSLGPDRLAVIDWRLRETPSGPKIVDIVVEGRSMILARRDEIARQLSADVPIRQLIDNLRAQAAKLRTP